MKRQSNQSGFSHIAVLMIIALTAVVGFAGWRVVSSDKDTSLSIDSGSNQQELLDTLPSDLSTIKTIDEIQLLAASEVSGATISGIELETEDGRVVYVVHLSDSTIIAFDAITGEVVQLDDDGDDDIDDSQTFSSDFVSGITIQKAILIAQSKRPGSTVRKVELEINEGVAIYSIRFTDGSRVDVSAADGSVQRLKDENGTDTNEVDTEDSDDDGIHDSEDSDDDDDGAEDADDHDDKDDSELDHSGSTSRN